MSRLDSIFELTTRDRKSLQERVLKLSEEVGEVSQAVLSATGAHGSAYKGLTLADVREEAVDAAIVALAVLAQSCDSREMFLAEMERLFTQKCEKWEKVLG
nr:MazG-like family protein [uncultured Cohaesibacter sp.]